MFIANSLQYHLRGYDDESRMWILDRIPDKSSTRQTIYINKAKFIDKANNLVYFLDEEGTKSLTHASVRSMSV